MCGSAVSDSGHLEPSVPGRLCTCMLGVCVDVAELRLKPLVCLGFVSKHLPSSDCWLMSSFLFIRGQKCENSTMGPFQEYEVSVLISETKTLNKYQENTSSSISFPTWCFEKEKKSPEKGSPRSRIPRLVLHPFQPKDKGSPQSDSPFSEEEGKECDVSSDHSKRTVSTNSFCSGKMSAHRTVEFFIIFEQLSEINVSFWTSSTIQWGGLQPLRFKEPFGLISHWSKPHRSR